MKNQRMDFLETRMLQKFEYLLKQKEHAILHDNKMLAFINGELSVCEEFLTIISKIKNDKNWNKIQKRRKELYGSESNKKTKDASARSR